MPPRDLPPTVYDNIYDDIYENTNRAQAETTTELIAARRAHEIARIIAHEEHILAEQEAENLLAEFNAMPDPIIAPVINPPPQQIPVVEMQNDDQPDLQSTETLDWMDE